MTRQHAPTAGEEKAETTGSSQGGAVDAFSTPAERTGTETRRSSQGGTVDASSALAGKAEAETRSSSQGGAVDASSAPAGRAESETRGSLKGAQWMPLRHQQGGPKATSAQHQLPTQTKGTVRIPPRSFWMVYVALFPW